MRLSARVLLFLTCLKPSLVHNTAAGAAASVSEGTSPSSLGAGKGQKGLSFLLSLLLVLCVIQLQKRVGLLNHRSQETAFEYCG